MKPGIKRTIHTYFWQDPYIDSLNKDEKLLYLYLLTNERTNMAGIYEIIMSKLSGETGIDRKEITRIVQKFEKDEKFIYRKNYIISKNFINKQIIFAT